MANVILSDNMVLSTDEGFIRPADLTEASYNLLTNKGNYKEASATEGNRGLCSVQLTSGINLELNSRNKVLTNEGNFESVLYMDDFKTLFNYSYKQDIPRKPIIIDLADIIEGASGEYDLGTHSFASNSAKYLTNKPCPLYNTLGELETIQLMEAVYGTKWERHIIEEILFETGTNWLLEFFRVLGRYKITGMSKDFMQGLAFLGRRLNTTRKIDRFGQFVPTPSIPAHKIVSVQEYPTYKEKSYTIDVDLEDDEGLIVSGYIIK